MIFGSLGLGLTILLLYFEIMNDQKRAFELGQSLLTESLEKIDEVDEETFCDTKTVIELLKENSSSGKKKRLIMFLKTFK